MLLKTFLLETPAVESSIIHQAQNDFIFSILIPTWNNLPLLAVCIESLKKNSRYKHQIILHINEGDDGTKEWAIKEGLDFTFTAQNIGICYAMNLARRLVKCNYIVYFNDDMYACPDWDFWLFDEIQKLATSYFFLSSTMIEPSETNNKCVISPHSFGNSPENFDEANLLSHYDKLAKDDWSGSTWPPSVVTTMLWDLVGGYSTEYSPGMYSDPDFSMKLWHAGVRHFKGVSKSRVYHFMSKSTSKLKYKLNGSQLFLNKWGVSTKLFSKHFLKRGEPWKGALTTPQISISLILYYILNKLKKWFI